MRLPMKKPFLLFWLSGALATICCAQPDPATPADAQWVAQFQRERQGSAASKKVAPDTGFYWLLRAGESLGDNPNPLPVLLARMTPAQTLAYDRDFAAHYSESLKMLRTALQKGVARSPIDGKPFQSDVFGTNNYNAYFRQLARALNSESKVRAAKGDLQGALDSRLDCLELGVIVSGGALIDRLTGMAIESIARKDFDALGAQLDAPTIRAGLERWKSIDARRPTLIDTLQSEKLDSIAWHLKYISDPDFKIALANPDSRAKAGFSDADAKTLLVITPESLSQSTARFFDSLIEREKLPYPQAKSVVLPAANDPFSASARQTVYLSPMLRLVYERNRVQNRLLAAALELRALKLETGHHPATFDAGTDPFSDTEPLIYAREGDSYRLYSRGPDGKDNGGQEIQTLETDEKTGLKSVSERLRPDSYGDILAPVF